MRPVSQKECTISGANPSSVRMEGFLPSPTALESAMRAAASMFLSALVALIACPGASHAGPDCDDAPQAAAKPKRKANRAAPPSRRRCVPKERQPDSPMGEMQVVDLKVEGRFRRGETISVTATVAEVTGYPNLAYPGIVLVVEPDQQIEVRPHNRYGVEGCGTFAHTWTFKVPYTATPGTLYRITALAAAGGRCASDPLACDHHRRAVVRRVGADR
jgi:hypothetical protein